MTQIVIILLLVFTQYLYRRKRTIRKTDYQNITFEARKWRK
jgi:hypothetical protein